MPTHTHTHAENKEQNWNENKTKQKTKKKKNIENKIALSARQVCSSFCKTKIMISNVFEHVIILFQLQKFSIFRHRQSTMYFHLYFFFQLLLLCFVSIFSSCSVWFEFFFNKKERQNGATYELKSSVTKNEEERNNANVFLIPVTCFVSYCWLCGSFKVTKRTSLPQCLMMCVYTYIHRHYFYFIFFIVKHMEWNRNHFRMVETFSHFNCIALLSLYTSNVHFNFLSFWCKLFCFENVLYERI